MKGGKSMLSDGQFRRTTKCSKFSNLLASKSFPPLEPVNVTGREFSRDWLADHGLDRPLLVTEASGLGLKLPVAESLSDIADIIGHEFPVKIMGVGEQSEILGWSIGDYAHYLANRSADHKVLNMISLEVSATPLAKQVHAPYAVRDIDWIDKCWPLDKRARGDFPQVQKYCLCGMGGAYTDFHIDFGGTSVWYHVLKGKKRFYFIPPTVDNLRCYEDWTCSKTQDSTFLGDVVAEGNCFQIDLCEGQTLIIPSAWIHAVYTPEDALVFGGNFLHSFGIVRQLQTFVIEQRTHVGKAYRFPHFKLCNWYVLTSLLPLAKKLFLNGFDGIDEDEDDEDLVAICKTIAAPHVFLQFPYLVRNCEIWTISSDSEELAAFERAAKEADCSNPFEVISAWWDILDALTKSLGVDGYGGHVDHIKHAKVFNLLDEDFINPVASQEEGQGITDDGDAQATKSSINEQKQRADIDSAPVRVPVPEGDNVDTSLAQPAPKPATLKFKLKLTNKEPSSSATETAKSTSTPTTAELFGEDEEDEEEENDAVEAGAASAKEPIEERKPSLKLKFNLGSAAGSSSSSSSSAMVQGQTSESADSSLRLKLNVGGPSSAPSEERKPKEAPQAQAKTTDTAAAASTGIRFTINMPSLVPTGSRDSFSRVPPDSNIVLKKKASVPPKKTVKISSGSSASSRSKAKSASGVSRGSSGKGQKKKDKFVDDDDEIVYANGSDEDDDDDDDDFASAILSRGTETAKPSGAGGGRYGTRGKRLSAAFLAQAEDVDIDVEDEVGTSAPRNRSATSTEAAATKVDDRDLDSFTFDDPSAVGEDEWVVNDDEEAEQNARDAADDADDESYASEDDGDEEYEAVPKKKMRTAPTQHADTSRAASSAGSRAGGGGGAAGGGGGRVPKKKTIRQLLMSKLR